MGGHVGSQPMRCGQSMGGHASSQPSQGGHDVAQPSRGGHQSEYCFHYFINLLNYLYNFL